MLAWLLWRRALVAPTVAAALAQPGFDPLACVLHIAAWRARSREAQWGERALAVSFPGEVGVALGLDIDMVLRQDPIDWTPKPAETDPETATAYLV